MKNVFTIDTEEWYHANFKDGLFTDDGSMPSRVEAEVDRYLELFEIYHVRATFFILGSVAGRHPDMIAKIAKQGHEIASHGYGHLLVYEQTEQEFREDVYKSKAVLEDLTGVEVLGYRAPSWSVTEKSLWALDILEDLGFRYTSSIFPTRNCLYGIPHAPRFVHGCGIYGRKELKIQNIPPSTIRMGRLKLTVPFSGGAYFRLFPAGCIAYFTDRINRKEQQPVIFYLHPREIDPEQPVLKLGIWNHMVHYYGVRGCEKKLTGILKKYDFDTAASVFGLSPQRISGAGGI